MNRRTLGVHGLAIGEAGLVRALLSLAGSSDPTGLWTFVSSGPCEVLLADATPAAAREAQARRQANFLVLLGADADSGSECLPRPLRADALERILRNIGTNLGVVTAETTPQPVPSEPALTDKKRYKLLRWPTGQLLRGSQRVRIATLLSRRYLSANELAVLTGVDAAECAVFLRVLQGFQLLQEESREEAIAAPAQPSSTSSPDIRWNLVRSIRRKLGL